jgi:predicted nucleotidyltransferase component of viral defense system
VNDNYINTVRLLLAVAPAVFQSHRFAMKGGTALNLFVEDLPRLSVDIDVVFIDYTLSRDEALQAIGEDLLASKSLISKMGYRTSLPTNKSGDDVKLLVEAPDARVKVEVNFVFRGTVLPTVRARLCDRAQNVFTTDIEVPMLEASELYGSKLVAAMDRQHPRDIFDVMKMREQHELDGSIIDCFVAYLAGHNRPVHEVLFPRTLPLEPTFTNEFEGMTLEPIQLSALHETQKHLISELPRTLSASHREFLLSIVRADPDWGLMPFRHLAELPALKWKLLNLEKLRSRNRKRFDDQYRELVAKFESL